MTRDDEILVEGFLAGLTCANGGACDYRRGSRSFDLWWIGFGRAKRLETRDKVLNEILKIAKEG